MTDHLDIGGWYDQAGKDVRDRIAAADRGLRLSKDPCRVLPLDYAGQWNRWGDEIEDGKKRLLGAKAPFHFASLGDAELALIGCGFPWDTKTINGKLRACGLSRFALGYRKEFVAALKGAALLGLHQRWPPVTEATARILALSGIEIPAPNGVEVHLLYKMMVDGSLFNYLADKRVVLLGDKVTELQRLWAIPAWCQNYAVLGPLDRVKIVGAYKTRSKAPSIEAAAAGGSWLDLDPVTAWLKKVDYDIALLGCGAVANLMGKRVTDMGRSALDMGFVFEALLGNSQRTHRPFLRDIKWPAMGRW